VTSDSDSIKRIAEKIQNGRIAIFFDFCVGWGEGKDPLSR